jgi:hypothetical protein
VEAATFRLDFVDAGDGTLTIDVAKAQACTDLSRDLRVPPQLRYFDGTEDLVVAYLPAARGPACRPLDPSDARRVVDEPSRHYVSLGPSYSLAIAHLSPLDPAPDHLPDTAEIVCSQDGAVSLTPRVQATRVGVRFRIYNESGAWDEFNLTSPAGGDSGGRLPRKGVFDNTWNIAPGPHAIGCFRDTRPVPFSDPTHPDYTAFTVVDPNGLWVEPGLDCTQDRRRAEVASDVPVRSYRDEPEMEPLIRDLVPGVRDGDTFVRVTYPESAAKSEHLTLVRDGRKVAVFYLSSEEDPETPGKYVWSLLPYVCPGSGIAE